MTKNQPTEVQQLLNLLDNLQESSPILWAILGGRSHKARIGIILGKTPAQLEPMIQQEVEAGFIQQDNRNPSCYFMHLKHPNRENLIRARQLRYKMEAKWLDQYPELIDTPLVSSPVSKVWKEANPDLMAKKKTQVNRFDENLTTKQAELLLVLEQWANGADFLPIQVAKAQGYTQTGWTKRGLDGLLSKGMLRKVRLSPATYRLAAPGLEAIEKAKEAGLKPARREGINLDVSDL